MQMILCLDDNNGMSFGGKRQSRDRVVVEKILELTAGGKIWMNGYSAGIFSGYENAIMVRETFLEDLHRGEFCFVENTDIACYFSEVSKLYIFRWNRRYPADVKIQLPANFTKTHTEDFPGNSHDKITLEVYTG